MSTRDGNDSTVLRAEISKYASTLGSNWSASAAAAKLQTSNFLDMGQCAVSLQLCTYARGCTGSAAGEEGGDADAEAVATPEVVAACSACCAASTAALAACASATCCAVRACCGAGLGPLYILMCSSDSTWLRQMGHLLVCLRSS